MSDNRQRPRIHRCDDKHDALIRAYAERHGIEPWQALETAIERLSAPNETAALRASFTAAAGVVKRKTNEIQRLRAELASARAAHKIVAERAPEIRSAPALPADFETKVRARAKAHGQSIERTRERVIELGFSRYDALAKAKGGRAP